MPDEPTLPPEPRGGPNAEPEMPEMPSRPKHRPEMRESDGTKAQEPETPGKLGSPDFEPEAPTTPSGGGNEPPPTPETPVKAEEARGGNGGEDPRVAELQSLVVHLKADFDNYKKRAQKEIGSSIRSGALDAVREFLPIIANLERALAAMGPESDSPLGEGIRQVYDQFQTTLKGMGIARIECVGKPFNPALHDAVAAAARTDVPPGTITDEFEPGYSADGRALVPAKVRVATTEG